MELLKIEIPAEYQHQVEMFLALLTTRQIDSLSDLVKKDGTHLELDLKDYEFCANNLEQDPDLVWQKIVDSVFSRTLKTTLKRKVRLRSYCEDVAVLPISEPVVQKVVETMKEELEKAFSIVLGYVPRCLIYEVSKLDFSGAKLTADQREGLAELELFLRRSYLLCRVKGYAGTGKSFLICEFIKSLKDQQISYLAACPTNKAAKNLRSIAEDAGIDLEVKTVAQLLGQQPELNERTGKEEFVINGSQDFGDHEVIIIDEFSMVNRENFREIINQSNTHNTKVVFVGDAAQLPPVKEQYPMVAKHPMDEIELTKIVRYDGHITKVAEAIRTNPTVPNFTTAADKTIVCLPRNEWLEKAITFFESPEYKVNPDTVRFLAWRNKTVDGLNDFVRWRLWGENAPAYVPGDRLIARKPLFRIKPGAKGRNKWRIFINNSEEATVTKSGDLTELKFNREIYQYWEVEVQPEGGKQQNLLILHEDSKKLHAEKIKQYAAKKQWSAYFDLSRMFDNVGYAYALTVHKAQGSTIDNVFLDIEDMKRSGDRSKLLYTAITRTKKQAFILE